MLLFLLQIILPLIGAFIVYNMILYIKHLLDLKHYPDGPFPWPIVGNILLLDRKNPAESLTNLMKKYGDVYSISFGMERVVVVNTIEPTREATMAKSGDFSGRPQNGFLFRMMRTTNEDILFSDYGPEQMARRRLASKAMKISSDHGNKLEEKITAEAIFLAERLMKKENASFDISSELELTIVRIMATILFGNNKSNKLNEDLVDAIMQGFKFFDEGIKHCEPLTPFPWLEYLPMRAVKIMKKFKQHTFDFLATQREKHAEKLDPNNPSCFLDWILTYSKGNSTLTKYKPSHLSDESIDTMTLNMVLASTVSTVIIIQWLFLHLLYQPEYIEKSLRDIRNTVGLNAYPKVKDKKALPIVQAVLAESLRLGTGPVSLSRKATKNSSLGGKSIRKETPVLFNAAHIHRDPRYWENPEDFKPERWLNESGKFISHRESYIPFQVGKRSCIGEQFATEALFLIFTRIIIDFKVEPDPSQQLPDVTSGISQIFRHPPAFKITVKRR